MFDKEEVKTPNQEIEVKELEDSELDSIAGGLQDSPGNGCSGWGCPCPATEA